MPGESTLQFIEHSGFITLFAVINAVNWRKTIHCFPLSCLSTYVSDTIFCEYIAISAFHLPPSFEALMQALIIPSDILFNTPHPSTIQYYYHTVYQRLKKQDYRKHP